MQRRSFSGNRLLGLRRRIMSQEKKKEVTGEFWIADQRWLSFRYKGTTRAK